MNPIYNFAMQSIQSAPGIANNPRNQNMVNILKSGNRQAGEEFANNYCKTMGITPEQIISQAPPFLKQMLGIH